MRIISISGIDGSGKSSQIKKLAEHFESQGKKIFTFHIIEFSIANKLLNKNKKAGESKAKTNASDFSIFLRKIALLIDIFRFKNFYKKLKKQNIDYILTDRYFYDQILNIFFLEKKDFPFKKDIWQKIAEKNIKKPYMAFYINIHAITAKDRDRDIEQGLEYLNKKKALYEKAVFNWEFEKIYGEDSVTEVFNKIKNKLKNKNGITS